MSDLTWKIKRTSIQAWVPETAKLITRFLTSSISYHPHWIHFFFHLKTSHQNHHLLCFLSPLLDSPFQERLQVVYRSSFNLQLRMIQSPQVLDDTRICKKFEKVGQKFTICYWQVPLLVWLQCRYMVLFKSGATVGSYAWGFLFKEADSYFHGGSDGHGYDTAAVPSVKKELRAWTTPTSHLQAKGGCVVITN